jgi:hypothetical protein
VALFGAKKDSDWGLILSQSKDFFRYCAKILYPQWVYGQLEVLFGSFSFKKKNDKFLLTITVCVLYCIYGIYTVSSEKRDNPTTLDYGQADSRTVSRCLEGAPNGYHSQ